MNFIEQVSAVTLLADFFLGVTFGVVGGSVHGSRLEDREGTLLGPAPDQLSAGARMILGVYSRDDGGYLRRMLSGDGQAPGEGQAPGDGAGQGYEGNERRGDGSGAEGKDAER